MKTFDLGGKTAAVTGAGSGIGRAIAELFASHGAHVAVLDVAREPALETVQRITMAGGIASYIGCDVTDASSVHAAFAEIAQSGSRLQILVNNAGIAHVGNLQSTTAADLTHLFEVNVKGVYACSQAAIGQLLNGGGVILNISSIAALIGVEDRLAYSMSKGAVLAMTRSIAIDYVRAGVRCNALCPARVHTPFVDNFVAKYYPGRELEKLEELAKYQPMGRMARPEEVAALALYLCSDEASFVTGQAFPLDGGVLSC